MKILGIVSAAALVVTAGWGVAGQAQGASVSRPSAEDWLIGPVIRGRNHSRAMPLSPTPRRDGGFHIDLPRAPGSVHYVTFPHGSLAGKRRIVMDYRVEMAPGVRIAPRTGPNGPSLITLYFQRQGDTWTARGPFETYRWYATFATQPLLRAGTFRMVAPLTANWTAVQSSNARTQPAAFRDAKDEAGEVGFVLGGGTGFGHGVFATGPARIVVTNFRVE